MKVNYVIYSLGALISYLNINLIYSKITKEKFKPNFIYLLVLTLLGVINSFITIHLPVYIKVFYNFICLVVTNKVIFKDSLKNILYYIILIWGIGNILDIIFMAAFSFAFMYLLKLWPNWGILFISLILQVLLNIFFRFKSIIYMTNKFKEKVDLIKNLVWLYILLIFLIVLFSSLAFTNLGAFSNVIMILFLVLIAMSVSIYFIRVISDEKVYNRAITNLLNNNQYYSELNAKNRVFKHNLIHRLDSIKTVSNQKANALIDDLIKDYNLISGPSKDVDLLPTGINGLICQILFRKDRKLKTAINNYLKSDLFEVLTPRKYNKLCETIGVCLDNAVTASEKSKEKILQIMILENDNSITIKIINTFKAALEIDKLGTINYTTKKDGHGLGLYSMFGRRDITVKTSIINNLFEYQINIKKKKSNH